MSRLERKKEKEMNALEKEETNASMITWSLKTLELERRRK